MKSYIMFPHFLVWLGFLLTLIISEALGIELKDLPMLSLYSISEPLSFDHAVPRIIYRLFVTEPNY